MFFPHFSHDLPLDPGSCELSHGFCTTLLREVSIVMLGLTETAQYAGSTSGSKAHQSHRCPVEVDEQPGIQRGPGELVDYME
jgi:hypothetical protein